LAADLPGRRQLMVREAQKEALAAVSGVFAGARKQLRRLACRTLGPTSPTGGEMQPVGT